MSQLKAVILAYNAEWSLTGGLSYLAETIRGEEPCELCRITYGGLTKKGEWVQCEKELRAPVEEVYKNQLTDELAAAIDGRFPMVLARTDAGVVPLVGPEVLDTLEQDPARLQQALLDALSREGIAIGAASS